MVEETRRSTGREVVLEAIKGSIKKWHDILHNDGEDKLNANCPLCKEFREGGCVGCPVFEKTKEVACGKTPWTQWREHQESCHHYYANYKIHCDTCRELAQAELDFLKDLYIEELESTRAKKEEAPVRCPFCGYMPKPGEILQMGIIGLAIKP